MITYSIEENYNSIAISEADRNSSAIDFLRQCFFQLQADVPSRLDEKLIFLCKKLRDLELEIKKSKRPVKIQRSKRRQQKLTTEKSNICRKEKPNWLPVYTYISSHPNCTIKDIHRNLPHNNTELQEAINYLLDNYKIVIDSQYRCNTIN